MEFNNSSVPRDSLPPPPPPSKMNLESPVISPDLAPTPSDYFTFKARSQPSSPSRHFDHTGTLSPPPNSAFESCSTSPSPNSMTEVSPSLGGSSLQGKPSKKLDPLADLVDSEREYVDLLAGIIRKVAGAWSRTNFPPKQLDRMFRGIEAIYKANRGLLTRLKDIGPTPASPKALGDLLMKWIDDLDAPYTKYCTNYVTGFDRWDPTCSNIRLPAILMALSAAHTPLPSLIFSSTSSAESSTVSTWTLDALFALPRARLKYYKKLYNRLLKNTQPGRSNHKLLTGAVEKLDGLLTVLSERENIVVGEEENVAHKTELENRVPSADRPRVSGRSDITDDHTRGSVSSSAPPSSLSSEVRASRDTMSSGREDRITSSSTMSMPISDLERRLSTERVLDIFTLKPKPVRLQMNPPALSFTRTLRLSHDVEIHFTPRITPGSPITHLRGHIFLLTDLFLVCKHMTLDERKLANSEGQDYDMWLLYPPLAGKHLRVSESYDQNNVLQVQILKKEILFLHAESKNARDHLIKEFKDCIEAANLISPKASQPAPPPVPPLKTSPLSLSEQSSRDRERLVPTSTPLSAASFVSASSGGPSPQLPSSGSPGNIVDASHHKVTQSPSGVSQSSTFPAVKGLPSHPNAGLDPMDPRSGRARLRSPSQPQPRSPNAPGYSPDSSDGLNPTFPLPLAPFAPPARGSSNPQRQPASGSIEPPARPATAPGQRQPQLNGLSSKPNYSGQYPPNQTQNLSHSQSRPSTQESLAHGQDTTSGPGRSPSDPTANLHLRKSSSSRSLGRQHQNGPLPPIPGHRIRPDNAPSPGGFPPRDEPVNFASVPHVHQPVPRAPLPPSASLNPRSNSFNTTVSWSPSTREPSPPSSPIEDELVPQGPVTSTVTAQFKCKVFLQLHHGQWKSLGSAQLRLYLQQPTNFKQLVVEADSKDKNILISTIVLTDGVERVGRTGVAIEISDIKGARTGIIYMIQVRNEVSASGLFDSLLEGSDRAAGRTAKG